MRKKTEKTKKEDSLKKKEDEIKQLTDNLQRLQAEFENYKKRVSVECNDFKQFSNNELIKKILSIIDNFELALKHANNKENDFYKGIELIYSQLIEMLKNEGVEIINPINEMFDPYKHEALLAEPSDHPTNTVLEVMQKGYAVKGRILRHAKVKVAKNESK